MAFVLEHFPTFPYPPSGMQEVGEVEKYLTNLHRAMQEFFSVVPRDIKDGISSVELDDLANTELADPDADRIVFWDDGAGVYTWLTANTGLAISTTNLNLSHLGLEALTDPGADRIFFWDDGETASKWLAPDGTTIEISGTTLRAVNNPHLVGYFDFDEIADPGAPSANDVRLFANEKSLIGLNEDDMWHDLHAGAFGTSSHIHTAITVSDANGLNITWGAGNVHDALLTGGSQRVAIAAQPSNQTMTAATMNHLFFDKSGGIVAITTDEGAIDFGGGDFPVAAIGTSEDDILYLDHYKIGNQDVQNIKHVMWHLLKAAVFDGLIVSAHATGGAFDVDMSAGGFIHNGIDVHDVAATIDSTSTNIIRWFHTSSVWATDANSQVEPDYYDNGTNKVEITGGDLVKYVRSTFYCDGTSIHWVYPQVLYGTLNAALEGVDPTPPDFLTHFPKCTTLIMQANDTALPASGGDQWIDVRPMLGAGGISGTITDHGNLGGLADDDHTQYTLHSLADAENDFLVASGANAFVKQTLAATGAILEGDIQHDNLQGITANEHIDWTSTSENIDTTGAVRCDVLQIWDNDQSNHLQFQYIEDDSADRAIQFQVGGGTRIVNLSGNLTVESASLVNQDLTSDASPTFADLTLTGTLTAAALSESNILEGQVFN